MNKTTTKKILGEYTIELSPRLSGDGDKIEVTIGGTESFRKLCNTFSCVQEGTINDNYQNNIITRYKIKGVVKSSPSWTTPLFSIFFTKDFLETGKTTLQLGGINQYKTLNYDIRSLSNLISDMLGLVRLDGTKTKLVITEVV